MCMRYYNTSLLCHHSQFADDVCKVHAITDESTDDFSGDSSGDWCQHSDFIFRYTEFSLTVLPMSCRTWLLEFFRQLVVGDATSICGRVPSLPSQRSSRRLSRVMDDNLLSPSIDACSTLFCEWFFLDILVWPYNLLSFCRHLLTADVVLVCARVGDEQQERQLFLTRFCSFGSLLICKLFFYTYYLMREVSDRDLRIVLLVSGWSVQAWLSGIHYLSTMSTCPRACRDSLDVGDRHHVANVTGDGEFLETGLQQIANVWSWYRTSFRKFVCSLCELCAASIETKANRTCIRLTNIEGSDPSGHLTHLSVSPSYFVSQRLNLSRWPTATPRLCRGHRGRLTAHYGSVP